MNRLEQIRQVSNLIQALQNLVTQCGDDLATLELKTMASLYLVKLEAKLLELIHSDEAILF